MTLKDLECRLRVLEDIEAIKELKSQFDEYQDDGQSPEAWSDLFSEDGEWPTREAPIRGPAAIRDYLIESGEWGQAAYSFTKHYSLNPIIKVDGDKAHGSWDLLWFLTRVADNQSSWGGQRLEEDYVRVKGQWKYKSWRTAEVYFSTPYEMLSM